MSEITWAPFIPLIGGFPLGAYKAIGHKPKYIFSYTPFIRNDSHLVEYWNDVPYYLVDEDEYKNFKTDIDIIVATPPCAGLSQLNTAKSESMSGGCALANEWMYISSIHAITHFNPKVIIGENAPALYTKRGEIVADTLYDIAKNHGYSLTLYKTNTIFHGLPQSRSRTFYFLWRNDVAPLVGYYKRDYTRFPDYLNEIPDSAGQQDLIINEKLMDEAYYTFIKETYNKDPRELMIKDDVHTAHNFVKRNNLMKDFVDWAEHNHARGYHMGKHALKKFEDGLGIWDSSVHVFNEHMNAVIGRNLQDTVHPVKNRSLNVREALHMMGFPHDFELVGGKKNLNHIAQNVPVNTSADMVREAIKYLKGELPFSEQNFVKQNNHKELFENKIENFSTLETFLN